MFHGFHNRDDCGSHRNNPHAWKDKEPERRTELNGRLCRHCFRQLPALSSQRVRKGAQGLGNRSSETVRLNQHGHERAYTLHIRAIRKRLPGTNSPSPSPLFKVDLQKLFTQLAVTHTKYVADTHTPLVQTQA